MIQLDEYVSNGWVQPPTRIHSIKNDIPSGKLTQQWICPFSIGNTSSKGPFSIAMLVYRRVVAMTIPRFRDFAKESAIRHFEAMGIKCVSPQCQLTFGFCQGLLYVPLRHHCKSLKTMVLMPLVLVIISSLNGTHRKPCVIFFLFLLSTQSKAKASQPRRFCPVSKMWLVCT